MFSRTFSLGLLLLTGGCGGAVGENKVAAVEPDERIECALGGAKDFTRSCAMEPSADGAMLTIRHGDGGFRRFAVAPDKLLTAADGSADVAGQLLPDGRLEIAVAGDRYRLPGGK